MVIKDGAVIDGATAKIFLLSPGVQYKGCYEAAEVMHSDPLNEVLERIDDDEQFSVNICTGQASQLVHASGFVIYFRAKIDFQEWTVGGGVNDFDYS